MKTLPLIDLGIILLYLVAMVWVGYFFSRKNKNAGQFTVASGHIPGWAIGLSIYATFLSSNTFLGVPGKAFGGNWNAFAFSLSMPLAAWLADKYFVPFYRSTGEVSAYTNLEKRFGKSVPGNKLWLLYLYKRTFVIIISFVRSMHDKTPPATWPQVKLMKGVGKSRWSPPVFQVSRICPGRINNFY